jgi:GntR family transcriptional regulator
MCHITDVTPFRLNLVPGKSIFDQVVFAVTRAALGGALVPGQPFPSVRALAADLKIHPNTAHKVIQYLIHEGWLESRPGIGTVVGQVPTAHASERKRLLREEVEQLVVEATRVGADLEEVLEAIRTRWKSLNSPREEKES